MTPPDLTVARLSLPLRPAGTPGPRRQPKGAPGRGAAALLGALLLRAAAGRTDPDRLPQRGDGGEYSQRLALVHTKGSQ